MNAKIVWSILVLTCISLASCSPHDLLGANEAASSCGLTGRLAICVESVDTDSNGVLIQSVVANHSDHTFVYSLRRSDYLSKIDGIDTTTIAHPLTLGPEVHIEVASHTIDSLKLIYPYDWFGDLLSRDPYEFEEGAQYILSLQGDLIARGSDVQRVTSLSDSFEIRILR